MTFHEQTEECAKLNVGSTESSLIEVFKGLIHGESASYSNQFIAKGGGFMYQLLLRSLRRQALSRSSRGRSCHKPGHHSCQPMHPCIEGLEERCLLSADVVEFRLSDGSEPVGITAGPDGNIWFTERQGNRIGRMTTRGVQLPGFPVPTRASRPDYITVGPEGSLWFPERGGDKLGRITLKGEIGEITEFDVRPPGSEPTTITVGPDGNIWFTTLHERRIARITPYGTDDQIQRSIWECPVLPPNTSLTYIVSGSDGNLWYAEDLPNFRAAITRMDTDCQILNRVEFNDLSGSVHLTPGPDGNIWYVRYSASRVGYIPMDRPDSFVEWAAPFGGPTGITAAPDGNVWFVQDVNGGPSNGLARVTPSGVITRFELLGGKNWQITVGPDGNLWYTSYDRSRIGKFYLLTATGNTLNAVAGLSLPMVVGYFHDDQPGMRASDYRPDIDWESDGIVDAVGQVWDAGNGNWVVTATHTYADPGDYWITLTVNDIHPGGMRTTTYSYVTVSSGSAPGGGGTRLPPDVLTVLLHDEEAPFMPLNLADPAPLPAVSQTWLDRTPAADAPAVVPRTARPNKVQLDDVGVAVLMTEWLGL